MEMRIGVAIRLSDSRALRPYAALEHERPYRNRQEKICCGGSPIPHCIPLSFRSEALMVTGKRAVVL
jgi:hypothetical protein